MESQQCIPRWALFLRDGEDITCGCEKLLKREETQSGSSPRQSQEVKRCQILVQHDERLRIVGEIQATGGRRWIQRIRAQLGLKGWKGIHGFSCGLFCELSVGIKGLMKCLLEARGCSDRQWSRGDEEWPLQEGSYARGSISWLGGVLTEGQTLIIKSRLCRKHPALS